MAVFLCVLALILDCPGLAGIAVGVAVGEIFVYSHFISGAYFSGLYR